MRKAYLGLGSLLAALAVILGAFGAHKLKEIAPESVSSFQTGAQYQMYHALALIACGIISAQLDGKWLRAAAVCFILGIFLFSGSLYLLTYLKATDTVGLSKIGLITPIGGLFFVAGWIALAVATIGKKSSIIN